MNPTTRKYIEVRTYNRQGELLTVAAHYPIANQSMEDITRLYGDRPNVYAVMALDPEGEFMRIDRASNLEPFDITVHTYIFDPHRPASAGPGCRRSGSSTA